MSDNNFLDNGSILPSGLLSEDKKAMLQGFAKSYQNFAMRVGVVMTTYPVNSDRNKSKLALEYDVLVIEQNADKGATPIMYKNCLSAEGLGAVADFFEKALRPKKKKSRRGDSVDLKGQDGAIVLMLCLDGMSDKGIIIGALTHPDRATTLTDEGPRLEGEYNGVNIKVEKDGSCSLTFQGATDNAGEVLDPKQGNTDMKIEKDGSWQVNHETITLRLDRTSGVASLHAKSNVEVLTDKGDVKVTATTGKVEIICKSDVNVTTQEGNLSVKVIKGDARVTVKGDATVECKGTATVEGKIVKLGEGASEAVIKGDQFQRLFDSHQHAGNLGFPTSPPLVSMVPTLSKKVKTE